MDDAETVEIKTSFASIRQTELGSRGCFKTKVKGDNHKANKHYENSYELANQHDAIKFLTNWIIFTLNLKLQQTCQEKDLFIA